MIGDVLTTSILFEAIKEKYPEAELHYLINSHTFPVVEGNPNIDKYIFFTPEIEKSGLKLISFAKSLAKEKYDVSIDVYVKISSFIISHFAKAKLKIGYHKSYSAFIFNKTLKRKTKSEFNASLAIENRMKLLAFIDIDFKNIKPKIYLTEAELKTAKEYLTTEGLSFEKPIYMISVLGSSLQKTYPFDYMASLLDTMVNNNKNAQILFNYIPKQEVDARAILELCKPETQQHIHFNIFGKSLREFLAITSHCTALIGNEGGAVNMAKALDIPTFTMFSPLIGKANWFGKSETKTHVAIHLGDYVDLSEYDKKSLKKEVDRIYKKFKPKFFEADLIAFLNNHK